MGSQQKPATSQLGPFRSEMSGLRLHTSSHPLNLTDTNGYEWIRIWKMCFPDIFFLMVSYWSSMSNSGRQNSQDTLHLTILTDHTDPEIWRYSLNWSYKFLFQVRQNCHKSLDDGRKFEQPRHKQLTQQLKAKHWLVIKPAPEKEVRECWKEKYPNISNHPDIHRS